MAQSRELSVQHRTGCSTAVFPAGPASVELGQVTPQDTYISHSTPIPIQPLLCQTLALRDKYESELGSQWFCCLHMSLTN